MVCISASILASKTFWLAFALAYSWLASSCCISIMHDISIWYNCKSNNLINLIQSVTILTPVSRLWVMMWVQIGESIYWFFTNVTTKCYYTFKIAVQLLNCLEWHLPYESWQWRLFRFHCPLIIIPQMNLQLTPVASLVFQDNYSAAWTTQKTHFPFYFAHSWLWCVYPHVT
jgi:hypothetical protein